MLQSLSPMIILSSLISRQDMYSFQPTGELAQPYSGYFAFFLIVFDRTDHRSYLGLPLVDDLSIQKNLNGRQTGRHKSHPFSSPSDYRPGEPQRHGSNGLILIYNNSRDRLAEIGGTCQYLKKHPPGVLSSNRREINHIWSQYYYSPYFNGTGISSSSFKLNKWNQSPDR
jgi:hypothetical protein